MGEIYDLEAAILEDAAKKKKPVRLITINGYQMNAVIDDFDGNVILCRIAGRKHMVYRNALSTIVLEPQGGKDK